MVFFPASSSIWKDLGWRGNLSKKCQDGNYVWRLRRPGCWWCDARPGEAATLGTSPLPARGWGGCSQEYQEWLHTTQPPPGIPTQHCSPHTTPLASIQPYPHAQSSIMLRYKTKFKMVRYYLCSFNNRYLKSVCYKWSTIKNKYLTENVKSLMSVCKCSGWLAAGCAVDWFSNQIPRTAPVTRSPGRRRRGNINFNY